MSSVLVTLTLFAGAHATAQDLTQFRRCLVPVYVGRTTLGAGVPRFATVLTAKTSTSIRYWPSIESSFAVLSPGYSFIQLAEPTDRIQARLLFIENVASSDVAVNLKVLAYGDTTAPLISTAAADIPIMCDGELRRGVSQFIGVPFIFDQTDVYTLDNLFRHTLRVYSGDDEQIDFIIRITEGPPPIGYNGPPLPRPGVTHAYSTNMRDGSGSSYPYYVSIPIASSCPVITGFCVSNFARIEIEPMNPNSRYWCVLTSTHNRTQAISVQLPSNR